MNQTTDMASRLDQYLYPAFTVKEGLILEVNHAAQYLGLMPGDPVSPLIHDSESYQALMDGCLYLSITHNHIDYSAAVIREKDNDLFVLDHDLEQQQLWTLALASQQIRSPAAEMMLGIESLMSQLPESEANRAHVANLQRSMNRLHRMLCNMSDAARYSCETPIHQQTQDMAAIINEVLEKAATLVSSKGVTLVYEPMQRNVDSLVDSEKLERAILNLISNALKATPSGGTIHVTLSLRNSRLLLTVQDSGPGIPRELRAHVFSRYLRKPSLTGSNTGLGLGLVIVRAAAAAHGGTVLVEQPKEGGTRVTVSFSIRTSTQPTLNSPLPLLDYAGGKDHALLELSDALPASVYE